MRFKIWHLMALTALLAIVITFVDWASHRTVMITITSTNVPPVKLNMPELVGEKLNADEELEIETRQDPIPSMYFLGFELQNGPTFEEGQLASGFGYNSLLDREVTPDTVSALQGTTILIRHRYVSLPWASATQVHDEISKHFEIHPKIELKAGPGSAPYLWRFQVAV